MLIAFSRYQKVGRRPSVWVQGDKNPENACAVLSKLSFCTLFKNLVDAPQVLQLQILVKIETTLFLVRIKLIRPPSAKHSPIQLSVLKGSEKFGFSEKNCDWVVKVVVECRGGVGWAGWVPVSSSGESTAGARPPPPPLTWGQVRAGPREDLGLECRLGTSPPPAERGKLESIVRSGWLPASADVRPPPPTDTVYSGVAAARPGGQ